MSAIDVTALGLASHVALGWTDIGPTGGCVAWVESRADECGRPRTDGQLLCPRHPVPLGALTGHDLMCWCPLEDAAGDRVPCHADVLLCVANRWDRS